MAASHVKFYMGQEGFDALASEGFSLSAPPHPSRVADRMEEIIQLLDHSGLTEEGKSALALLHRLRIALDAHCFLGLPEHAGGLENPPAP